MTRAEINQLIVVGLVAGAFACVDLGKPNVAGDRAGDGGDMAGAGDTISGDLSPGDGSGGDVPMGDVLVGDSNSVPIGTVDPVFPINGADWNDYVLPAADTACVGTELGRTACVHAGERRRITVTGETSCADLTASDALDAFDWRCNDTGGQVIFESTNLRRGVGLADLVTAAGFVPNHVTIARVGVNIFKSLPAAWWSSSVIALVDNAGPAAEALSTPGGIYVLEADKAAAGYSIDADRIAVVTINGATLSQSGTANNCNGADATTTAPDAICLLAAPSRSFLWIEGTFDNAAGGVAALLVGSNFSVLRNLAIQNGQTGLSVSGSNSLLVLDVTIANVSVAPVVWQASHSVIHALAISNGGTTGLALRGGATNNTFTAISIAAVADGLTVQAAPANTFSHVVVANNTGDGIRIASADFQTLIQVVVANNAGSGIFLDTSNDNVLHQIAAAHNDIGINLNASDGNTFGGDLLVGNHTTANCQVTGGTTPGIDATCNAAAVNTISGVNLAGELVGRVPVGDTVNPNDDTTATAGFGMIADWIHFETRLRGWGVNASPFPNSDNRGPCTSGVCRIWDWRAGRVGFRLTRHNGSFSAGVACPASASGDVTVDDLHASPNRFLVNALEQISDGVGDDDGLCESNERCIFSPHIGAYQGEGPLSATPCIFSDGGGASGVTLVGHDIATP